MVSRLSPAQSQFPDDLVIAESPSLRRRPAESEFSERPLFIDKPSLPRRASRAFIRYLLAVGVGVAATLAWQSYGDGAKQMVASWAAQQGWSLPWLSREADEPNPPTPPAAPVARTVPETVTPAAPSLDQQRLAAITDGLAAMQHRIEQLAVGQEQMASDIAKLQTAEQEIRRQIAAAPPRPAVAPAGKAAPAAASPSRSSTPPR
jgi:hypothetical protein